MSNHERLQKYIAHLKNGESTMGLLNDAKNRNLTIAMKAARDLHVRSSKPKPKGDFVNSLEQELLVMNNEGRDIQTQTMSWQMIPVIGAVALITIFSWRILKPSHDTSYTKRGNTPAQAFAVEESANILHPSLVSVTTRSELVTSPTEK